MDNGQAKLEEIVQTLFKLYAPGGTYKIVEAYEPFGSSVVQVLELPEDHESIFSSHDVEYQFWTLVNQINMGRNLYGQFIFRTLVDKVLYVFEYSKDVAYALAVMYALIVLLPQAQAAVKTHLNQRAFILSYLEDGE